MQVVKMTLFCYRSLELHMCARDCAEKLSELVWIGESLFETYRLKVRRVILDGFKPSNEKGIYLGRS